ncbi:MAG: nickel-dependent lactate racemase [Bacteroidetes bacterium]|nr:nickel-dependent lactate racemase [Bacteroidota bacterium]
MTASGGTSLTLAYGSGTQQADIPASWNVTPLRAVPFPSGRPEEYRVEQALRNPIDAPLLEQWGKSTDHILILVSDKTRRCRTDVFLPLLLSRLEQRGIPDEHIRLLFANGTHPAQTEEEMRSILGDAVFDRYAVFQHDARDEAACVHVGTTQAGTDIRINRLVLEADRVIATGTVVHHYFAGFGGGVKLFMPGIASYATAVQNHRRTITEDGRFHPLCGDGRLEGNPVITDIMDARRFMSPTWYFAAILDEAGRIADCVCGDPVRAHEAACAIVDFHYRVPVPAPADLTIVSTGGYPKDINFIQAHKSLHHAAYTTRRDGAIVFLAECREGIGNEDFLRWFEYANDDEFRAALLEQYGMNAHTALATKEKAARHRIIMVSDLSEQTVRKLGMRPAADLRSALAIAGEHLPERPAVVLLENGSLVVPRPEKAEK